MEVIQKKLFTATGDSSIIDMVDNLLTQAVSYNASDIHFEPYECLYRIRYRIDGLLHIILTPPKQLAKRISTRIKIMANLDISQSRLPQDGRFNITIKNPDPCENIIDSTNTIDCRVSTCPTISGEKIVIRLLNQQQNNFSINKLGFIKSQQDLFEKALTKPNGIILVTGPTGSGKTLTLYSALKMLNNVEKNITTIEDPVEIKISGINQIPVNPKIDLTFAKILRSLLRQDPDIIMLGEMRDKETCEAALKASQTGHLVLSTLHTNNTIETLARLSSFDISPGNIANALSLIIAQRLVRKLCDFCKIKSNYNNNLISNINITNYSNNFNIQKSPITSPYILQTYKANNDGCEKCINGYKGRFAVFEVFFKNKILEQLIITNKNYSILLAQAKKDGMLTLYESAVEAVKNGLTSFEEINRVISNE